MNHAQPDSAKLSDHIARLQRLLAVNDVLTPATVAELVAFNRRLLVHLGNFAADYEAARGQSPSPQALPLAADAAVRFYHRMVAPSAPLCAPPAARATTGFINLDKHRRPS